MGWHSWILQARPPASWLRHQTSVPDGQPERRSEGGRHIPELDSLRGLAALVVVLNHAHQLWLEMGAPRWIARPRLNPLLWLLVNGHGSVILFFLLSGFVLMLPYLRHGGQGSALSYPRYVLRRFLRIYPPYALALVLSMALCAYFSGRPSLGNALAVHWPRQPDGQSALAHVAMVRTIDVFRYDPPVWSLVHEARLSLLFPLLALLALRLRGRAALLLAGLCAAATPFLLAHVERGLPGTMRLTAWSFTLSYAGIFLLGAVLAGRRDAAVRLLNGLSSRGRLCVFAAALLLFLYPVPSWHRLEFGDIATALAGCVLLTFALRQCGPLARLLRLRPVHYVGTISYSLYLLHMPVLLVLCASLPRNTPFYQLLPLYLGLSLGAAAVFHRLVEVPSIALSRRAGRAALPGRAPAVALPGNVTGSRPDMERGVPIPVTRRIPSSLQHPARLIDLHQSQQYPESHMSNAMKTWAQPRIKAVEQLNAAQVAGFPMGTPKTTPLQTEGVYQGGNS